MAHYVIRYIEKGELHSALIDAQNEDDAQAIGRNYMKGVERYNKVRTEDGGAPMKFTVRLVNQ